MSTPENEGEGVTVALILPTLFPTGLLVGTPGAEAALLEAGIPLADLLMRHLTGDWGDLGEDDKAANDEAVRTGEDRIHSAYLLSTGTTVWIITEWDRSATTVLLPIDY